MRSGLPKIRLLFEQVAVSEKLPSLELALVRKRQYILRYVLSRCSHGA